MPNPKHVERLREGEKAWNGWRRSHPDVTPNLQGADLRKISLRNFDLGGCDLSSADARDVSFRKAILNGANLRAAKLYRAFFSRTELSDASMSGAILYETVFADVDLTRVRDLAACVHKGPSVLDHRTLARSRGLPVHFLRGCGLPDFLIHESVKKDSAMRQYWSAFISYSSEDQEFAERLYDDLQGHGVRCWYAPKDMQVGAKIRDAIDEAIRDAGRVILILSSSSLSSGWVETEFETTFEEEQKRGESILFPIRLDDAPMNDTRAWVAAIKHRSHIADFTNWREANRYASAFDRLVKALERNP